MSFPSLECLKLGSRILIVTCSIYLATTLLKDIVLIKKGGGVAIFLKNSIPFQRREDLILDSTLFDSVFIEIDRDIFRREKNIIIGVIYRPPDADLESFIELMGVLFEKVKSENKMCYLMGDYNTNLLNYDKHNLTTDFVDLFHSYSYVSLINRPTRTTRTTATLIDNILTNSYESG